MAICQRSSGTRSEETGDCTSYVYDLVISTGSLGSDDFYELVVVDEAVVHLELIVITSEEWRPYDRVEQAELGNLQSRVEPLEKESTRHGVVGRRERDQERDETGFLPGSLSTRG